MRHWRIRNKFPFEAKSPSIRVWRLTPTEHDEREMTPKVRRKQKRGTRTIDITRYPVTSVKSRGRKHVDGPKPFSLAIVPSHPSIALKAIRGYRGFPALSLGKIPSRHGPKNRLHAEWTARHDSCSNWRTPQRTMQLSQGGTRPLSESVST
jgi:hypothetical protein